MVFAQAANHIERADLAALVGGVGETVTKEEYFQRHALFMAAGPLNRQLCNQHTSCTAIGAGDWMKKLGEDPKTSEDTRNSIFYGVSCFSCLLTNTINRNASVPAAYDGARTELEFNALPEIPSWTPVESRKSQ